MNSPSLDQVKAMAKEAWAAGNYVELSRHIEHVGVRVVEAAQVSPGAAVLDVACGAGNAALPAARAGATVTGLDLVPALLDAGRKKAADAGVEITWVEGDAEALPFDDDSFDVVFSTFGHMFAPRHDVVAAEMARVTRPGGLIAICCWTPEGTVGEVFATSGSFLPPPPPFASPPVLWGTRDHVHAMFPGAADVEFAELTATIEWRSPEDFADYFLANFPMMVVAARMLGDRFADLRAAVLDVWRRRNEANDGTLVLPQEYLQSLVRLA
ncbi:class I SAM-dependent methyltransferase [Sporichthya polymorpha]|uniref:class I SAM-dependent methyltransferase n=1 Tax=Sporichthya polymorpha TaxID=35751 RepID=UPI0003756C40|nr:class I SAM-dependent methyltransferase [Sporichthya polymorpha]